MGRRVGKEGKGWEEEGRGGVPGKGNERVHDCERKLQRHARTTVEINKRKERNCQLI